MNVFLQFLFDVEKLNKYIRNDWIEIYDTAYIDNTIIRGIEERLPQLADLLGQLSEKATGRKSELINTLEQSLNKSDKDSQSKLKKREPTQQVPFNLTQPKPKALPEPIKIPKKVETKPIPYEILNKTNLKKIEEENKKRLNDIKEKIQISYKEAPEQPFQFELDKRPTNTDKIIQEVNEERNKELKLN